MFLEYPKIVHGKLANTPADEQAIEEQQAKFDTLLASPEGAIREKEFSPVEDKESISNPNIIEVVENVTEETAPVTFIRRGPGRPPKA